jgi:hypothetical protein
VDAAGNLYIADAFNGRIRKIDTKGIITTVVGNGKLGPTGDGGQAAAANLVEPTGVATDSNGNLYIADSGTVRRVDPTGVITTIAGGGSLEPADGIPATDVAIGGVQSLVSGASGAIYGSGFRQVFKLTPGSAPTPAPVVTIDSLPENLAFTISGSQCPAGTYTTPTYVTFTGSDTCTVTFNQTYPSPLGGRWVFSSWQDGATGGYSRTVMPPTGAETGYFANFQQQFPLTLSIEPALLAGLASVTASPASADGYYNAGSFVEVTAKAPPGYMFTGFAGGLPGIKNRQAFELNAATMLVAKFALAVHHRSDLDMPDQ